MIIDLIVAEIRHPYRYVRSDTFPLFQIRHYYGDNLDKDTEPDDWKNIRTVCRTWRQLAGPQPHVLLRNTSSASKGVMPKGASSLFVDQDLDERTFVRRLIQSPTTCFNLTTLAFSYRTAPNSDATEVLLDNPSLFPNLQSLSLWSIRTKRPFWKILQDDFPQLIALSVRYYVGNCAGPHTLWRLEILDINAWRGVQLSCPSLKHLSIRSGLSDEAQQFVQEHSHQLESLLLDTYMHSLFMNNPRFWTTFPNLVTLGKPSGMIPSLTISGHPFSHLRVFSWYTSLEVDQLVAEIDSCPNITHIHIPTDSLRNESIGQLRNRCKERNIEVVELPKMRVIPSTPKSSAWGTCCEITCLVVTCPCWLPYLLCGPPIKGCVPK
ncbi:hypothetical protein FRC17_010385 [Serendipita sp. 399]|nr:hypothetical protein FRC17_010385 [Serendipita sp. 399]